MTDELKCPLCLNIEGGLCRSIRGWGRNDTSVFECDICGTYELTIEAYTSLGAGDDKLSYRKPTPRESSILSYKIRTASAKNDSKMLMVTDDMLISWLSDGILPSPAIQAENLIRFVGDEVSRSGKNIPTLPRHIYAIMGSSSYQSSIDLAKELWERRLLRINSHVAATGIIEDITLSLDGWERYEAGKRGEFEGSYGFIAMKFDDPELDPFVKDVVKPAVKEGIGYDLVDMRNVPEIGIIDNIMRIRIRDSAFVIADLTHDNYGAYWESGYAEGLGKPVVYICEKAKFHRKKPHFDTNHCTTVLWSKGDPEEFKQKLIATLRRSLDLPVRSD